MLRPPDEFPRRTPASGVRHWPTPTTGGHPELRLVGHGSRRPRPGAVETPERAIARENLEAASARTLDPTDPRWVVAVEAAAAMEGSLLTFERRRRVLALAQRIGVRPFDANLIIAAVQDRARRGEPIEDAVDTIAHTARPSRAAGRPRRGWLPIAVVAIATLLLHGWIAARLFS
jgi:hypothetical protein